MRKNIVLAFALVLGASVAQAHTAHEHAPEAKPALPEMVEKVVEMVENVLPTTPAVASPANQDGHSCQPVTEQEIASLFDRWNSTLKYGNAAQVARNYAGGGVLLPTVSNRPRVSREGIEDYFVHFQSKQPTGTINSRTIRIGCNMAVDMGVYTFDYAGGGSTTGRYTYVYEYDKARDKWLILNHHSSALPQDVKSEGWDNF